MTMPQQEFEVVWRIQLQAPTARDAAIEAQRIQRDPFSTATVFEVNGETLDLEVAEDD